MKKILAILAAFLGFALAADIEVSDIFVRQTPPNAKNTAIFLTLKNTTGKDISLVDAESNLSEKIELHTHLHDGGKMTMMKVDAIVIPANSSAELKPGGDHIMLFDIKESVKSDTKVDLTLSFSNGESLNFENIAVKDIKKHKK